MKKIFLLMIVALGLFACEGPTGPMGPMGPMGPQGESGATWQTIRFKVHSNHWERAGDVNELGSYFFYEAKLPEITSDAFNNGLVFVYLILDEGTKYEARTDITQGFPKYNTEGKIWQELLSYDYFPGYITFYSRDSEFITDIMPETSTFDIIIGTFY